MYIYVHVRVSNLCSSKLRETRSGVVSLIVNGEASIEAGENTVHKSAFVCIPYTHVPT